MIILLFILLEKGRERKGDLRSTHVCLIRSTYDPWLSLSLTLILSLSDHSLTFSLALITLLHTYVIGYCSVYDTWNVYFHTFNKGVVYSPAPLLRAGFMTRPVCARGLYLEYWYLYYNGVISRNYCISRY